MYTAKTTKTRVMIHFKNRLLGTAAGVLSVTFRLGRGKGGGRVQRRRMIFFLIVYDAKRVMLYVVLLFYVHGKHLRSCRDGQLT